MNYDTNPLSANVVFNIGQPIVLILICFTAVAGLLLLAGKLTKVYNLESIASRWTERFLLATLHVGLIWIGLSMVVSYISTGVMDTVNGVVLISGAIISLVRRATSDQRKANKTLVITYIFLAAVLLWTFIFANVLNALPSQVRDAVADTFRPTFFKDLFTYWHWM